MKWSPIHSSKTLVPSTFSHKPVEEREIAFDLTETISLISPFKDAYLVGQVCYKKDYPLVCFATRLIQIEHDLMKICLVINFDENTRKLINSFLSSLILRNLGEKFWTLSPWCSMPVYLLMLKIFHSFTSLTCEIFSPLKDKLHTFAPPCIYINPLLYMTPWQNAPHLIWQKLVWSICRASHYFCHFTPINRGES